MVMVMNMWAALQRIQRSRHIAQFYHIWFTGNHTGLAVQETFQSLENKNPNVYIRTRIQSLFTALQCGE